MLQAGAGGHKIVRQMLKLIQVLEDGRVPAKQAKDWKIEGQKKRITRKEYQRLLNKCEMEGFMAQKGLWMLPGEKVLQDRGEWFKEEGAVIRECKAMHEDNFLSSWLREGRNRKGGRQRNRRGDRQKRG